MFFAQLLSQGIVVWTWKGVHRLYYMDTLIGFIDVGLLVSVTADLRAGREPPPFQTGLLMCTACKATLEELAEFMEGGRRYFNEPNNIFDWVLIVLKVHHPAQLMQVFDPLLCCFLRVAPRTKIEKIERSILHNSAGGFNS